MNTTEVNSDFAASDISHFTLMDYSVFGMLLACSTTIGLYFGFFSSVEQTTDEYLNGGHKMQTFPIAVSLVTSIISAWTVVAVPTEVYTFGWMCALPYPFAVLLIMLSANYLFLPVYHQSGIDNCYVYLELRFSRTMRCLSTIVWLLHVMFYMPIILYLPSLAFAEVTGYSIHTVNTIACYCCVIYTLSGGIKAVVWTDVVQGAVMMLAMLMVILYGLREVGGIILAWDRAVEGRRVFVPNLDVDFTTRSTFWNMLWGPFISWSAQICFNQSFVQRVLSLPTLSQSRRSIFVFAIGVIAIKVFSFVTGITMYAYYYGCDPLQAHIIDKVDQMVPRFVQDSVGHIIGMPGIFISCVFSASLSTVSANLNTIAGVLYMDFIRPLNFVRHTDATANRIMKLIVFITGTLFVVGVWIIEKVPSCFHALQIVDGMIMGSTFGVFSFGMLYPWANRHGALYGVVISMAAMFFIIVNTQMAIENGLLKYSSLPTSVDECNTTDSNSSFPMGFTNQTEIQSQTAAADGFALYKIAFMWYCPLGALLMWTSGIMISHLTGGQDLKQLDLNLMSPAIKYLLPGKYRHMHLQMDEIKSLSYVKDRAGNDGV